MSLAAQRRPAISRRRRGRKIRHAQVLAAVAPPLVCGFAPMRRLPSGASAASSGMRRPSARRTALRGLVAAHPTLELGDVLRGAEHRPAAAPGAPGTYPRPVAHRRPWGPVHPLGERSTIIGQRGRPGLLEHAACRLMDRGYRRSTACPWWWPSAGASSPRRLPSTKYGVQPQPRKELVQFLMIDTGEKIVGLLIL